MPSLSEVGRKEFRPQQPSYSWVLAGEAVLGAILYSIHCTLLPLASHPWLQLHCTLYGRQFYFLSR
jgi:hypothetical protein